MSSYSSYVPWRKKESSVNLGTSRSSERPTSVSSTTSSASDKSTTKGYADLQSYRPTSSYRSSRDLSSERLSTGVSSPLVNGTVKSTASPTYGKYSLPQKSYGTAKTEPPKEADKSSASESSSKDSTSRSRPLSTYNGTESRFRASRFGSYQGKGGYGNNKKESEERMVTSRSTSPTPPSNSLFLRTRRAELEQVVTTQAPNPAHRPTTTREVQTLDPDKVAEMIKAQQTPHRPAESPTSPTRGGTLLPSPSVKPLTPGWLGGRSTSSTISSGFTPKVGYAYSRPTDLPLRTSLNRFDSEPKSESISDDSKGKTKDVSRIGGFSYVKSSDLSPKSPAQEAVAPKSSVEKVEVKKSPSSSKLKKTASKKSLKEDMTGVVNKDFRKSSLNMDGPKETVKKTPMKSKSQSKLKTSPSLPKVAQQIAKQVKETSSSSSESSETESSDSSSEEESSGKEERVTQARLTIPRSTKPTSSEERSISSEKPPIHPAKSTTVIAKVVNPACEPMKTVLPEKKESEDEAPQAQAYKPYKIRKFDSGVAWWMQSNTDVPNLAKTPSTQSVSKQSSESKSSKSESLCNGQAKPENIKELSKSPSVKLVPGNSSGSLLSKSPSSKSVPKQDSDSKPKSVELPKSPSSKSIPKLQSVSEEVVKSPSKSKELSPKVCDQVAGEEEAYKVQNDAPDAADILLQPSNFTPALSRLYSKKALEDRGFPTMYKIRKMDSCDKPWWLEEESSPLKKSESKGSIASLKNTLSKLSSQNTSSLSVSEIPLDSKDSIREEKTDSLSIPAKARKSNSLPGLDKVGNQDTLAKSQSATCLVKKDGSKDELNRPVPDIQISESVDPDSKAEEVEQTNNTSRLYVSFPLHRVQSGEVDWWLEDEEKVAHAKALFKDGQVFIGPFQNIDLVLGSTAPPPSTLGTPPESSSDESDCEDCFHGHDHGDENQEGQLKTGKEDDGDKKDEKLEDTALQVYKDGDFGAYLDLEASIDEQKEEFDSFTNNRKNSIVLRTQLSVRVHTIIEKVIKLQGKELRKALLSLKKIFEEDKHLVHEFVRNDGLSSLIRVGSNDDQISQNYILRALGQIMLYVDGMNGVINHASTIQWLYILVSSSYRVTVKLALKLLLVFVEYVESNCLLLVQAIRAVDYVHRTKPWSNFIKLLKEEDTELLVYAMSLINKTLNGLPDQDMYYDQVDALEEQGIEDIAKKYLANPRTDLDLLRQFQIYEVVLQYEDGEEPGHSFKQLDVTLRKLLQDRRNLSLRLISPEKRKSRRYNSSITPATPNGHNLENEVSLANGDHDAEESPETPKSGGTVKDLSQKLANSIGGSPEDLKMDGCSFSEMKGIVSKAKEGLARSQSKSEILRSPTNDQPRLPEIRKTETDLHWEELVANSTRDLCLCDLDFRDLASDEDRDILAPSSNAGGIPPPPPPCIPPPVGAPPPVPSISLANHIDNNQAVKKTKKTVKLFWKEVREDPIVINKMSSGALLWDEISPVPVDTQRLEHLFESRAKDLITKKQQEMNKNKEIYVLDPKRSNAINIGMTKLPPSRSIKTAILKMDATVMNKEGIEKLLTMLPTEEERSKIQEAQVASPELPLGTAEQFLLTLASISELEARLRLWAFKLDYENCEKEIAEPLMDLKQGMEILKVNKTFRAILSTLLSIGIFLNGAEVKGFQIEYLSKVPEVKDTVHKHSLLHHLCFIVMEKFPDSTDLYSEIGAVTRASKVDFDELSTNLSKIEQDCKASFDYLKLISKHDGPTNMKLKMSDFLAECAERIIVLTKVHRRVMNRFHKFCLWLGIPLHRVSTIKPNEICQIVSEFSLEYRTTRERVIQQRERKAYHRERNKTRGKMITEMGNFKSQDVHTADAELKQLLGTETLEKSRMSLNGVPTWRRSRKDPSSPLDELLNGDMTDPANELLESLVKTVTSSPRAVHHRERKRARNADRKSLRRTLRNGLTEEERQCLASAKISCA